MFPCLFRIDRVLIRITDVFDRVGFRIDPDPVHDLAEEQEREEYEAVVKMDSK